ncbi:MULTISPECIES: MFS transporter [Pseudothermotoga]|uniref:Major facilitator superfamily MFS_1 n=1 Tax=Pseudothermotoga lettingae (strain ATCC BAA-301 / DSM 14385 / NBRC 107922 / TMO) TaxID=416591 RepID=A8F6J9_PSELT|nr:MULTISPECIES: MFS transporter [Pseudothermotoga]ABV33783.1 major facilitator superfamily MFS_1 [Pseudothermotoga lettingae TMO]MDI3495816.1 transporter, putative metabolite:H+ symporter [Pseudothermotoga sp.]GLI49288.1 permease [Pseudothermotoga lettingae TMO]
MKIDEVVEKYVDRKTQRKFLLLTSIAWMFDAAGVMLVSFVLVPVIREWGLSSTQGASIASITFLGMLVGALLAGFIADLFGRKISNLLFFLCTITFTFLSGFTHSLRSLLTLRAFSGFGYGGLMPSFNTYLSEFTGFKIRGRYLVLLESSWAVGSILIGLFAVFVLPNWRWIFWIFAAGYLFVPVFAKMSETPKYSFLKGGKEALEKAIGSKICEDIELSKREKTFIFSLFKKDHLKDTVVVWGAWFVVSFVYYALFTWAPKIFSSQGISVVKSSWFTFYMMLSQLPGYLSAAYFIEKWGRKVSLGVYFIGTGISTILWASVSGDISLLISALVLSFFCLGVWGLVYAYTPELYPTFLRGTGNGAAGVWARIAGIIAPYYTGFMMEKGKNLAQILGWICVIAILTGIAVLVFGRETRGKYLD